MAYWDTNTVGTGKDHATLNAAEDAHDGDSPSGDGILLKCTGIVDTSITYWMGWGAGLSSSCKITIVADTDQDTDGIDESSGAQIKSRQNPINGTTNPIALSFQGISFWLAGISCLVTNAANGRRRIW